MTSSPKEYKPSDFARLGSPNCSRWGKSEIEWLALAYVQALANDGDTWKKLTRKQTYALLTEEQRRWPHSMLTLNFEPYEFWFETVSNRITSAEGALSVGGFWTERALNESA